MCGMAALQLFAWDLYRLAGQTIGLQGVLKVQRSLTIWPFATERETGLLNLATEAIQHQPRLIQTEIGSTIDRSVSKALELDPLNWSVRLEQAWFEIAFTTNRERALSNAWLTVRLNPLQGKIPLEFARRFATNDPDLALRFLEAVHPEVAANHREALNLAWSITHGSEELWKLTPNTTNAIVDLIRFATETKQYPVAGEACRMLENRLQAETVAQFYLDARQPNEALRLVSGKTTVRARAVRVEALAAAGRNVEAVSEAIAVFADPLLQPLLDQKWTARTSFTELVANQKTNPTDSTLAILLAEKAAAFAPPELTILSNLTTQFPSEPRIAYLLFKAETNDPAVAAKTASHLAEKVIEQLEK
jgi:hypothetical protein